MFVDREGSGRQLKLAYQAARLCVDAGLIDTAHELTDHGLKYSRDAKTKERFETLKATLPPRSESVPITPVEAKGRVSWNDKGIDRSKPDF